MTTPNIEELMRLAAAYGDRCADVREYLGANAGMDEADRTWIAMKQASQTLMDALQSQAERVRELELDVECEKEHAIEMRAGLAASVAQCDNLRAQLAALQVDDELPEPFAYALETTNYGLDAEQWVTVEFRKDKWDEDCWPLFRVGQLCQAQSMVRAKMVPLEKDAARYRWLRDSEWEMFRNSWLGECHIYGEGPDQLDAAIDAAIGITGELK